MKQLGNVLRFSLVSQIKSKAWIISSVIMAVLVFAVISIPSIIDMFSGKPEPEPGVSGAIGTEQPGAVEDEREIILISDPEGIFFADTAEISQYEPGYLWKLENGSYDSFLPRVEAKEIAGALIVYDAMNATYIYSSSINVFGSSASSAINSYLSNTHRVRLLETYGVSEQDSELFFLLPTLNEINAGMANIAGQVQGMVFILLLYMSILSSGVLVATSVAQEKSSRAMEILITTSRPETLMFGKVIGIGLAGLLQMAGLILTGVLAYFVNRNALMSAEELSFFFKIPPASIIYCLLFFFGGYFFYAMMFSAIGSLVSRTEDLSTSQTPLTLLTVAGFLVAIYGQMYGFADTVFYKVCSYVPLTSPYVMMARVCGEEGMPLFEAVASVVLLYLSTVLVGLLSARIYRVGVLMYGKPPSAKELLSALRQSR